MEVQTPEPFFTEEVTPDITEEATLTPTEDVTFPELPTDVAMTEEAMPANTDEPTLAPVKTGLQLLAPADKSTVTTGRITFSWTEVPGVRWYRLHLYRNNGKALAKRVYKNPARICANGVCSVTLMANKVGLRDGRRYKWFVVAKPVGEKQIRTAKFRFDTNFAVIPTTNPHFKTIYRNNFDIAPADLAEQWSVVPSKNGSALKVDQSDVPTYIDVLDRLGDGLGVKVQGKFKLNTGSVKLSVQTYTAELFRDGRLNLYRNAELIESREIGSAFVQSKWHLLSLSVIGSEIKIVVDKTLIITYSDLTPLPVSLPSFSAHSLEGQFVLVDNLRVSITALPSNHTAPLTRTTYELRPGEVFLTTDLHDTIYLYSGVNRYEILTYGDTVEAGEVVYTLWDVTSPTISYDGTKIVFRCGIEAGDYSSWEICIINVDPYNNFTANMNSIRIISDLEPYGSYMVGWAPATEGNKFYYIEALSELMIYDADQGTSTSYISPLPDDTREMVIGHDGKLYFKKVSYSFVQAGHSQYAPYGLLVNSVNAGIHMLSKDENDQWESIRLTDPNQYPYYLELTSCAQQYRFFGADGFVAVNRDGIIISSIGRPDIYSRYGDYSGCPPWSAWDGKMLLTSGENAYSYFNLPIDTRGIAWSPDNPDSYATTDGQTITIHSLSGNGESASFPLGQFPTTYGASAWFDWKIITPHGIAITLDVDYSQLDPDQSETPYTFEVGETIPLLAVFEAGTENTGETVRVELTVPRGLQPQGMTIQGEDPITLAQIFEVLICLATNGDNCGDLLNDILDIFVTPDTITYVYDIEAVTSQQPFRIDLDVVGDVPATFTISAQAIPLSTDAQFRTFSTRSSTTAQDTVQLQVTPPLPFDVYVNCILPTSVTHARGRSEPSTQAAHVADYGPGVVLTVYDITEAENLTWYRVTPVDQDAIWVVKNDGSNEILLLYDPANPPTECDAATPTPAPTFTSTPTSGPTLTPTPFVTPTLYPTTVPGTPVPGTVPAILCSNEPSERAWLRTICQQGWTYLSATERAKLNTDITSNPAAFDTYIKADWWWLNNTSPRRGINDVPPAFWNVDCAGNSFCTSIVSNTHYLYDNMGRIGVDTENSAGNGQRPYGGEDGAYFVLQQEYVEGLLPPISPNPGEVWGILNSGVGAPDNDLFACGYNDITGEIAGICWVCQDLPTELYRAAGFDLQAAISDVIPDDAYPATESRFVPAIYRYLVEDSSPQLPEPGGSTDYVVGDMVMLVLPNLREPDRYFHVGIVIKGSDNIGVDALDDVLIAQISFSSRGFFTSNSDLVNYSEPGKAGRFEVIRLRTYLYKHAFAQGEAIPSPNDDAVLRSLADTYLRRARVPGLGE